MLGLMQDWQLLCHRIIDHAAQNHGQRRIVTFGRGATHTTTMRPCAHAPLKGHSASQGRHQAR